MMEDMVIAHSAKGSTWVNHKYIKILNGRYIYPESGSRTKVLRQVTKTSSKNLESAKTSDGTKEVKNVTTSISRKPGKILQVKKKEEEPEYEEIANIKNEVLKKGETKETSEEEEKKELDNSVSRVLKNLPMASNQDIRQIKELINKISKKKTISGNRMLNGSIKKVTGQPVVQKKRTIRTLKSR